MNCSQEELLQLTNEIWESYLEETLMPTPAADFTGATRSGVIHVHGDWEGTVSIQVSEAMARSVAEAMFATPAEELPDDEISDALGEITNMVGGSIKSIISGIATLSLPTVISGNYKTINPGTHSLVHLFMTNGIENICVEILERE